MLFFTSSYISSSSLNSYFSHFPLLPPPPLSSPRSGVTITGVQAVARHLCRVASRHTSSLLYGTTSLEKAEIDHWLQFSVTALTKQQSASRKVNLARLDSVLSSRVYLVGYEMTIADLAVFGALRGSEFYIGFYKHKYVL